MSTEDVIASYKKQFDQFETNLNGQKQLFVHPIRQAALKNFEELGIPTTRHEEWKYTSLAGISKEGYAPSAVLKADTPANLDFNNFDYIQANKLVFVDGFFAASYSTIIDSQDGLIIGSLADAIKNNSDLVEKHYDKQVNNEKEALTALNTAFAQDGAFIYVPKNARVEHPVVLIFVSTESSAQSIAQPRNLIVAEQGSEVKVVESFQNVSTSKQAFTNAVTEVVVQVNASVEINKVQIDQHNYSHIESLYTAQAKDSHFKTCTINFGGDLVRNNIEVSLNGSNAECDLIGIYNLDEKDHVDNHLVVNHNMPHCLSNQLYKGIMDGHSTGVFNGKVYVAEDAQKTNAYQQNKNVLLSDTATINTKPQLEIFADDVKCSHGATSGKMDKNALFYLKSRGLKERQAQAMMNQAFLGEVIDQISIEPLRVHLTILLNAKFEVVA